MKVPKSPAHAIFPLALAAACAMPLQAHSAAPQPLQRQTPIERSLGGTESHTYAVRVTLLQMVKVVVDQRGVDVVVQLSSPRGAPLKRLDSPNGDMGPEELSWIAEEDGAYQVTVTPLEGTSKPGKYEIRLSEIRAATRQERELARAEAELRASEEAWQKAISELNRDEVARMMSEGYTQSFPVPGRPVETRESALRNLEEQRKARSAQTAAPPRTWTLEDLLVRVYGDTSFVTGRTISTPTAPGLAKFEIYFAHVWRKEKGRWVLAHDEQFPGRPLPEVHNVIRVPEDIQREYAGRYENRAGGVFTVESQGDHLVYRSVTFPDAPPRMVYPETETDYFTKEGKFGITFVRNRKGEVTHAIRFLNGAGVRLTRLK